jgi:hypothetical protein
MLMLGCIKEWDIYRVASCDYWRWVYDLIHEYNMTNYYSDFWTSSST